MHRERGAGRALRRHLRSAGAWVLVATPTGTARAAPTWAEARGTIVAAALGDLGLPDDGLADRSRRAERAARRGDRAAARARSRRSTSCGARASGWACSPRQRAAPALEDRAVRARDALRLRRHRGRGRLRQARGEAFLRALRALGAGPADAWMVGDNLVFDVGGAQAVGMHGVWVDIRGRGLPDAPWPCPTGSSRRSPSSWAERHAAARHVDAIDRHVDAVAEPEPAALAAVQRGAELGHLELLRPEPAATAPSRRRRRRSARTGRRR